MLLAYIDEIGEPGAFIARDHPRFNTSPAFGYAGFVIPADNARRFGSIFAEQKRVLFSTEIEQAAHQGRWEKKGASIFRPQTHTKYPQQLRVFNFLVKQVRKLDGYLFYYANEKPLGTPAQTELVVADREMHAMRDALNRIARHADSRDSNVMVIIDQINEKTRAERLPKMYSHILGRAVDYREMQRIIEPPMHVDSVLSANIQFADWVAACLTRAIEYQLIRDSPYRWVTEKHHMPAIRGSFTHESKIHLWHRSINDLHHSTVVQAERPLYPEATGQLMGSSIDPDIYRRIKAAAERAAARAQH